MPRSTPSAHAVPPRTHLIRDMPEAERPRQRLLRSGPDALSDAEVLAVLLGSGSGEVCPLELAREILQEAGGVCGLNDLSAEALRRPGLGDAKAAAFLAAIELAGRLIRAEVPETLLLARPATIASYLSLWYRGRHQEVMGALFLDGRNRLMAERELFRGSISRETAEPRQILREALLRGASGLVIFHTHPSGDPNPSLEDLQFTRRMARAAEAIGVRLLDHLILGGGTAWVSLKERGAC